MAEYISTSPTIRLHVTGSNPDNFISVEYIDENIKNYSVASFIQTQSMGDFIYQGGYQLSGSAYIYADSVSINIITGLISYKVYVSSIAGPEGAEASYKIKSHWHVTNLGDDTAKYYRIRGTSIRENLPIVDQENLVAIDQYRHGDNSLTGNIVDSARLGVDEWLENTVVSSYKVFGEPIGSLKKGCCPTFNQQLFLGQGSNNAGDEGVHFYTLYRTDQNLIIEEYDGPYSDSSSITGTQLKIKASSFREGIVPDRLIFVMQGQGGCGGNARPLSFETRYGGGSGGFLCGVVDISWTDINNKLGFCCGTTKINDATQAYNSLSQLGFGATTCLYKHPLSQKSDEYWNDKNILAKCWGGGNAGACKDTELGWNDYAQRSGLGNGVVVYASSTDILWLLKTSMGFPQIVVDDWSTHGLELYATKYDKYKTDYLKLRELIAPWPGGVDVFNGGVHNKGGSQPNYGGQGGAASYFGDGGRGGAGVGGSSQATDGVWGAGGGGAKYTAAYGGTHRGRGGTGFVAIFY